MGKVTDSLVQSSGDAEIRSQRETGGFRRARGERNLKVLSCRAVAQDWGGFTCLGRMGLSLKAQWIGRCAAPWTRPKGDDTVPRPTRGRMTRGASTQWEQ